MSARRFLRRRLGERGASLVEFALVFPVLVVVIVGALSLLWLAAATTSLDQATRRAARFAATPIDPTTPECAQNDCPPNYDNYQTEESVRQYLVSKASLVNVEHVYVCPNDHYAENGDTAQPGDPPECRRLSDDTCKHPPYSNQQISVRACADVPDIFKPFAGFFTTGGKIVSRRGETRSE